jgi:hypothetical protein
MRMIWAGNVARMGKKRNTFRLSWERERGIYH